MQDIQDEETLTYRFWLLLEIQRIEHRFNIEQYVTCLIIKISLLK